MHHRLRLPLAVILAAAILATAAEARAQTRAVSGVVTDSDGAPVAGATVQVKDAPALTATTNESGAFTLAKVSAKNVVLQVSAPGHNPTELAIKAGRTAAQVAVALVRTPVPAPQLRLLSGLVRSSESKAAVAGATVKVRGTELGATTDADGVFIIPNVPVGDVVLDVSAADHAPGEVTVGAGDGVAKVELTSTAPPAEPPPVEEPLPPTLGRAVSGRVIEADTGEPLPGATVQVVGTDFIALADENGAYTLEGVPDGPLALEVTSLGYRTARATVPAGNNTAPDIQLAFVATEAIYIEARAPVIVKQNLANGASVVKSEDLNRVSAQTVDAALTGKVSGANIQSNSGAPGGGMQIRLRGISTINGQSSPLFVVDGVAISNTAIASNINIITGAAAGGNASNQDNPVNRLADLNPNDIENIEILKGPAAAALYGSQAANGVVIITTKRGSRGKPRVSVIQRLGFSQISNKIGSREFGSAAEVEEAYGPGTGALFSPDGPFDHEGEIMQSKLATETIATASGGLDAGSYYGSVLVKDEPGIIKGTFYEKQSGKVAVTYDFGKKLQIGATANIIHSLSDRGITNNDNTGTSYYMVIFSTPSFIDLRPDAQGNFPVNPFVGSGSNPMQTVELLQNREDVWRGIGSLNANYRLWNNDEHDVSLNANFGVDRFQQKNEILSPPELHYEVVLDGLAGTRVSASSDNLNWNSGVGGLWQMNPKSGSFKSALSAGFLFNQIDLDSVYVVSQNLVAGQPTVDAGTAVAVSENVLLIRNQGLFVQEEVALFKDRLTLLAALLGERSSVNGDTDKFFLFPKASAIVTVPAAEDTLEYLRVRAAYGEAGNRPNYGQKFTPLNVTNNINGAPGAVNGGILGAADIKPEHQREVEFGVDVATDDERIVGEITLYQRTISDLLLQRALPPSTGFAVEFLNGGTMRNRGIEASVQAAVLDGKDVNWVTRGIFTLNRSEITDLDIPPFDVTTAGFGADLGAYRVEVGRSATNIIGGADINGDGVPFDTIGDGEPDFRVGWANQVKVGDFGLTTLLDWQKGSDIVNLTKLLYDFAQTTPDYTDASDPICDPVDPDAPPSNLGEERLNCFFAGDISAYVEDASFLKIREISLFYDVPAKWATQIGPTETLRLSLSGRNLLTFTNYSGLDPEVSNFGNQPVGRNIDVGPYPPSRSFWFSVEAGF